jgi:hypothetical protein
MITKILEESLLKTKPDDVPQNRTAADERLCHGPNGMH